MSTNLSIRRRALLAGGAGALLLPKARPAAAQSGNSTVARLWAGLTLQDATGQLFRLGELQARTKLVKLWAHWCAGCLVEVPSLTAAAKSVGPDALDVILVSHPEFWQRDLQVARRLRMPFRLATLAESNPAASVKAALLDGQGAYVVPRALLFRGSEPTLAWSHMGTRDWAGATKELVG